MHGGICRNVAGVGDRLQDITIFCTLEIYFSPSFSLLFHIHINRNGFTNLCDQALKEHCAPFHNRVAICIIKMSGLCAYAASDAKLGRVQRTNRDGVFEYGRTIYDR